MGKNTQNDRFRTFLLVVSLPAIIGLDSAIVCSLWDWFVTPIAASNRVTLAPLTLYQALGVAMIVTWATFKPSSVKDEYRKDALTVVENYVVGSLVFWGVAWAIAHWITR